MPTLNNASRVRLRRHVIINERVRRGWTKKELAEKMGVPAPRVSRIENGGACGPATLAKLAEALEMDITEISYIGG